MNSTSWYWSASTSWRCF